MDQNSLTGFLYGNFAPADNGELMTSFNTEETLINHLRSSYNEIEDSNKGEISSYEKLQRLKDKFIIYMNNKNASIFDFITKPISENHIINDAVEIVNKYENKNYQKDKPLTQFFENNLEDAKEWLNAAINADSTLEPSASLKKNIEVITNLWLDTIKELSSTEDNLITNMKKIQNIQKKIEILQLLPMNESLIPVLESLEKYIETAYNETNVKDLYYKCLKYYKRVYVLHDLMASTRVSKGDSLVPNCPICFDNNINICLVPCGHTFCSECDIRFKCAICRTNILSKQKLYFS